MSVKIVYEESFYKEFEYLNTDKAQAWLRGKGVKDALVYWTKPPLRKEVTVEVPTGSKFLELAKESLAVGRKT